MAPIITSKALIGNIIRDLNAKDMYVSRYACNKKIMAIHAGIRKASYISNIYKCDETDIIYIVLGTKGWLEYNTQNNTIATGTLCKNGCKITQVTLIEHSQETGCAV